MSSKKEKVVSVPKFTSFKPRPPPEAVATDRQQLDAPRRDDAQPSRAEGRDHRHRHRSSGREASGRSDGHRIRDRDRDRDRGRDRPLPRENSEAPRRAAPTAPPAPANPQAACYVVDKRGDPLIRKYGGNSRYEVPKYRRYGSGRILGADGYLRIESLGSRDVFTIRGFNEGGGSADRKSVLGRAGRESARPVRVRKEQAAKYTGAEDFLPLRPSKKRKRGTSPSSDTSSDQDGPSYRSIHGKSKPHEFSDSDEEYGSDTSGAAAERRRQDLDDPIKAKTMALSQRVRDHPQDVDAWLALVDHQDTLLRLKDHDGQKPTPAEIKSFADIKLSMLEKALAQATLPNHQNALRLRIMKEGVKTWDSRTTAKRWEELVKDHGANFDIWRGYVASKQTDLGTLRYEDVKQLYVARLHYVRAAIASGGGSYGELIAVFTRMLRFIAETGYSELAAAAWQAILELHFCRPPTHSGDSTTSVPPSFQDFWESEVARIGDDSAKGWATFELNGGTDEAPEPKTFDLGTAPRTRDPYKAWAAVEQQQAAQAQIPARTLDDGTEDDPYRVVVWSDIQDLLFCVPQEALSAVHQGLLDAFLVFYQLPPAFGTSEVIQGLLHDELIDTGGTVILESPTDIEAGDAAAPFMFQRSHLRIAKSPEVLFADSNWFNYMSAAQNTEAADRWALVSRTLKHLTHACGVGDLASYYLALEMARRSSDAKKTSKALLKQYPTHIELYLGYASFEFAHDNKTVARNAVSAALGLPNLSLAERLQLCHAGAWMEMEDSGSLVRCLSRLCLVGEEEPSDEDQVSPALVLKVRQLLASNRDYLISQGDIATAALFAKSLALLEYLTQQGGQEPRGEGQGDIASAMASVEKFSEELKTRELASHDGHEQLLQFASQLLYVHIRHGSFRPAFLREKVLGFLGFFPDNTILLSLYAWKEARLSVDDRVRALLHTTVLTGSDGPPDGPSSRVFAIRHELRAGNANSTRAAFEHALEEAPACRHHVGLWRAYVRFCCAHHTQQPRTTTTTTTATTATVAAAAVAVFYRALRRCPWAKPVFLEAFAVPSLVRDGLDTAALRAVYATLADKGLRVHVDLDDFLARWKTAAPKPEPSSSSSRHHDSDQHHRGHQSTAVRR